MSKNYQINSLLYSKTIVYSKSMNTSTPKKIISAIRPIAISSIVWAAGLGMHSSIDARVIFEEDFMTIDIEQEPSNWLLPERRPTRIPVRKNLSGEGKSLVFPLRTTQQRDPHAVISTPSFFSNTSVVDVLLRFQMEGIVKADPATVNLAGSNNWPLAATIIINGLESTLTLIDSNGERIKIADLKPPLEWNELLMRVDFQSATLRFVVNGKSLDKTFPFRTAGVATEHDFRVLFGRRPHTDTMRLDKIVISEVH